MALVDFVDWDYDVDTPFERPLGGAHSAACYLAIALARQNHQTLYINNTTRPGLRRGVHCANWQQIAPPRLGDVGADAYIVLLGAGNGRALKNVIAPQSKLILWTGHAHTESDVQYLSNPLERDAYNGIALVSEWQAARYREHFHIPTERIGILRNAISPAFENVFPAAAPILSQKPQPPIFAYTSTPFRGLHVLLDLWPRIRERIPGSVLRVFSSMQVYNMAPSADAAAYGVLYDRCRTMEGVEYLGAVPQPELAQQLKQASLLVYPNTFAETSCISVMEAMAAGCDIVTTALGALPETLGAFGQAITPGPQYAEQFIDAVVRRAASYGEDRARALVDHAQRNLTWDVRAREWTEWIARL